MKRPILFVLLLLAFLNVNAQSHLLGIQGNLSWTNVSSKTIFESAQSQNKISGGITYEYFINDLVSLGSGLSYEQRGFYQESFLVSGEAFPFSYRFDYLSLPIKIGSYTSNNGFFGFAKAGLVPSYLIKAETAVPMIGEENNLTDTQTVAVTKDVSAFDLAGLAELGGGYKASNRIWVTGSISYQHSLSSITNANFFSGENVRHQGLGVNLGLLYGL